jgi:hypothetical protein
MREGGGGLKAWKDQGTVVHLSKGWKAEAQAEGGKLEALEALEALEDV